MSGFWEKDIYFILIEHKWNKGFSIGKEPYKGDTQLISSLKLCNCVLLVAVSGKDFTCSLSAHQCVHPNCSIGHAMFEPSSSVSLTFCDRRVIGLQPWSTTLGQATFYSVIANASDILRLSANFPILSSNLRAASVDFVGAREWIKSCDNFCIDWLNLMDFLLNVFYVFMI